jgi:DNA-binding IclR family transcriptional regulator
VWLNGGFREASAAPVEVVVNPKKKKHPLGDGTAQASPSAGSPAASAARFGVRNSGQQTPALDRALAVLEFIAAHPEGVTRQEIGGTLGFSNNLVFRLTRALVAHGYVEPQGPGRRYVLTRQLLKIAQPKRDERSLVQLSFEPMRWLRDATGESAHVGIRIGDDCLVLDRVIGSQPYKCYVEAGTIGPLHAGAPGKVMLAWLPPRELEATLDAYPFTSLTPHTITSRKEFATHLKMVRERGWAMDLGETMEGHHCLGAPILDRNELPVASIWITAISRRLPEATAERLAPTVIRAAEMVSEVLR